MYEDDTIRLYGVADLLKNKKNNSNNWERDDIPDIKQQALTGKYDHNFDAPGSDFVRAHQYNFHNTEQPENTKTDVKYDDKYTKFFNYTPSKYIQLEEEEYKPIGKYNEKADEYYIDKLQGKTLDDMVISKMKENAGADDLDPRAARERFAENLAAGRLQSALEEDDRLGAGGRLELFGNMEEEAAEEGIMAPRRGRKPKSKEKEKEKIQIEPAQLSSSSKKVRSLKFSDGYRSDDEGGGGAAYVTRRSKQSSRDALEKEKQLELKRKEQDYQTVQKKREGRLQLKKEEEEAFKKKINASKTQKLGNVFGKLKQNAEEAKIEKEKVKHAKAEHENRLQGDVLRQLRQNIGKRHQNKELQERGNTHHQQKALKNAFATLRSNKRDNWENVEFATETVEKSAKKATKSPAANTDVTDVADYMGGSGGGGGGAYVPRGQHPNTSLALQRVAQGKLESKHPVVLEYKNSYKFVDDDIMVDKGTIRAYNKDVKPKVSIKLTEPLTTGQFKKLIDEEVKRREPISSDTKLTAEKLDALNSPAAKKGKGSESGSQSPKQAIEGMYSHHNPRK